MGEIRGQDLGPNNCHLAHRYISFYFIHIFITDDFLLQLQVLLMKRGLEMGGNEENRPKRQLGCHLGLRFFSFVFFLLAYFFYIYRLYFMNYNHHHPLPCLKCKSGVFFCSPTTTTPPHLKFESEGCFLPTNHHHPSLTRNMSQRGVPPPLVFQSWHTLPCLKHKMEGPSLPTSYYHPPSLKMWDGGPSLPTNHHHTLPCPPTTTTPPLLKTQVRGVFPLPWSSNHNPHPPSLEAWDGGVFLAHHTHPFPLPHSKHETEGFSYLSSSYYHICWWQKPAHTPPLLKMRVGGVFLCLQLGPKWQVAVVWAILSVLCY